MIELRDEEAGSTVIVVDTDGGVVCTNGTFSNVSSLAVIGPGRSVQSR